MTQIALIGLARRRVRAAIDLAVRVADRHSWGFLFRETLVWGYRFLRNQALRPLGRAAQRGPVEPKELPISEIPPALRATDFDEWVGLTHPNSGWVLMDGRLVRANYAEPMRLLLSSVLASIERQIGDTPNPTLIDFGCGAGSKLIYLARKLPHCRFIGVDMTGLHIARARQAAMKFGVEAEFHTADVTRPLDMLPDQVDVCYSTMALTYMPRIFPATVEAMVARSRTATLMFELVPEAWPLSWRGVVSRLRASAQGELFGLPKYLRQRDFNVSYMRRMGLWSNPLGEVTEICILPPASTPSPSK